MEDNQSKPPNDKPKKRGNPNLNKRGRKSLYGRNPRAPKGKRQKRQSGVDHAAIREDLGVPLSAPSQQMCSATVATNPRAERPSRQSSKPKSPPKSEVKRRNTILQKEVHLKSCENEKLVAQKKKLVDEIKQLNVQLRNEKRVSRDLIRAAQNKFENQL